MSDTADQEPSEPTTAPDDSEDHPALAAINADHVVEDPGDEEAGRTGSPAGDADAPAPPG